MPRDRYRRTREHRCRRKVRHADQAAAQRAAALRVTRGAAQGSIKAYACQLCGGWHTGHDNPRRRR